MTRFTRIAREVNSYFGLKINGIDATKVKQVSRGEESFLPDTQIVIIRKKLREPISKDPTKKK